MYILGISAYYHDSAAVLIKDGEIIAAAQEERFTRKKQDSSFPKNAIEFCLKKEGIDLEKIDHIAFYEKPFLKFERLLSNYIAEAPLGFTSFLTAIPGFLKEKLFMKKTLVRELKKLDSVIPAEAGIQKRDSEGRKMSASHPPRRIRLDPLVKPGNDKLEDKILFPEHHQSHAASAFFPSLFKDAAILTIDGVGEWTTTSLAHGKDNNIHFLKEIHYPHSLGLLYSAFTYYTGFKVNSGEYKVMGLAPYGEPKYVDLIKKHLIDIKEDGSFRLNMDYFNYTRSLTMTNKKFHKLFGSEPRKSESELTQKEMDLARSVQEVVEEVILKLVAHAQKITRSKNLCLAGGVALNCVANGKILESGIFKNIWIEPAAGDAGGALGAALAVYYQELRNKRSPSNNSKLDSGFRRNDGDIMKGAYLGPKFSNNEVQEYLDSIGAKYKKVKSETELFEIVAEKLTQEKVVGWHQGEMEFGPRALGNRSIIGDPRSQKMQSIMNLKIKYRESFRPFAPSVLAEDVNEYFELNRESPYMLLVSPVQKKRRKKMTEKQSKLFGINKLNIPRSDIPSITHVDYSARVQTVHKKTNSRYHGLISKFKEKTGCGVIVNTSFNVRGEPIVCTPEDSYRCFMRTEMDVLVIEDFILYKEEQPSWEEKESWQEEFELD